MRAWRVHGFGEPQETFVVDDVAEPTAADLSRDDHGPGRLGAGGPDGREPFDDWVICSG